MDESLFMQVSTVLTTDAKMPQLYSDSVCALIFSLAGVALLLVLGCCCLAYYKLSQKSGCAAPLSDHDCPYNRSDGNVLSHLLIPPEANPCQRRTGYPPPYTGAGNALLSVRSAFAMGHPYADPSAVSLLTANESDCLRPVLSETSVEKSPSACILEQPPPYCLFPMSPSALMLHENYISRNPQLQGPSPPPAYSAAIRQDVRITSDLFTFSSRDIQYFNSSNDAHIVMIS